MWGEYAENKRVWFGLRYWLGSKRFERPSLTRLSIIIIWFIWADESYDTE